MLTYGYRLSCALLISLLLAGCGSTDRKGSSDTSSNPKTPVNRFILTQDTNIAFDTQTGQLCKTTGPSPFLDPACQVTEEYKKLGFIPDGCKGGETWVAEVKPDTKVPVTTDKIPTCISLYGVYPTDAVRREPMRDSNGNILISPEKK